MEEGREGEVSADGKEMEGGRREWSEREEGRKEGREGGKERWCRWTHRLITPTTRPVGLTEEEEEKEEEEEAGACTTGAGMRPS